MKTCSIHKNLGVVTALIIALFAAIQSSRGASALNVEVTGDGPPMILVPGLSCPGDIWDETVKRHSTRYQCHQLTFAGFAGIPPIDRSTSFSDAAVSAILDYIADKKLQKPNPGRS